MLKKLMLLGFLSVLVLQLVASRKVYLIHGFGGKCAQMEKINKALIKNGYTTENYDYLSLEDDVDSVGKMLFDKIKSESFDTVSFVTHSMGALVFRAMNEYTDTAQVFPLMDRIVMIAPPNNGSPVADYFAQYSFFKFILGPNITNLTTDPKLGAAKYPIPGCEVGLIAGKHGDKKGYNVLLKTDNDGVLAPEKTKLGIEKDVVFVTAWHNGLLRNEKVIKYTLSFLKTGKFKAPQKPVAGQQEPKR